MELSVAEQERLEWLAAQENSSGEFTLEACKRGQKNAFERVQADSRLSQLFCNFMRPDERRVVLKDTMDTETGVRVTLTLVSGVMAVMKRFRMPQVFELELVRQDMVCGRVTPQRLYYCFDKSVIVTRMGPHGDLWMQLTSRLNAAPPPTAKWLAACMHDIAWALSAMNGEGMAHMDCKLANVAFLPVGRCARRQEAEEDELELGLLDYGSCERHNNKTVVVSSSSTRVTTWYCQDTATQGIITNTADMFSLGRMVTELMLYGPMYPGSAFGAHDLSVAMQAAIASGEDMATLYTKHCGISPSVAWFASLYACVLFGPAMLLMDGGWNWTITCDYAARLVQLVRLTHKGATPEELLAASFLERQLLLQLTRQAPKSILLPPTLEAVRERYVAASQRYQRCQDMLHCMEGLTGQQHQAEVERRLEGCRRGSDLPLVDPADERAFERCFKPLPRLRCMTLEQMEARLQAERDLWEGRAGEPDACCTQEFVSWALDPEEPADALEGRSAFERIGWVSAARLSIGGLTLDDLVTAITKRRQPQGSPSGSETEGSEEAEGSRRSGSSGRAEDSMRSGGTMAADGTGGSVSSWDSSGPDAPSSGRSSRSRSARDCSSGEDEEEAQETVTATAAAAVRPLGDATNRRRPARGGGGGNKDDTGAEAGDRDACVLLARQGCGTTGCTAACKPKCTALWLCASTRAGTYWMNSFNQTFMVHEKWRTEERVLNKAASDAMRRLGGNGVSGYLISPLLAYAPLLPLPLRERWHEEGLLVADGSGGAKLAFNAYEYPLIIKLDYTGRGNWTKAYCSLPLRSGLGRFALRAAAGRRDAGCGEAAVLDGQRYVLTAFGAELWNASLRAMLASEAAASKLDFFFSNTLPATLEASAEWRQHARLVPAA